MIKLLEVILDAHVLKGAHESILLWHRNLVSQDIPFQDFDCFQIPVGSLADPRGGTRDAPPP